MKLVILVTAKIELGLEVAQSWQDVGAPGVTILRSHGLHTLQKELEHGDIELPRMVASMASAMATLIENVEERGEMILSLVDDDMVDALIAVTNQVLGDLMSPNSGVLFVIPVERAVGVRHHGQS
ncbi:MAG: hypothetical protein KC547_09230 [Anaerolineae bacterium]|nr:hypothetical protein [Anaerolineae bacterium]MCA9909630.1 hypothetical protein [Anaerolineae bacterium]